MNYQDQKNYLDGNGYPLDILDVCFVAVDEDGREIPEDGDPRQAVYVIGLGVSTAHFLPTEVEDDDFLYTDLVWVVDSSIYRGPDPDAEPYVIPSCDLVYGLRVSLSGHILQDRFPNHPVITSREQTA